jgi:GAF domain-containing protein
MKIHMPVLLKVSLSNFYARHFNFNNNHTKIDMTQQEYLPNDLPPDIDNDIALLRNLGVQLAKQSNLETLHEQIVDAAVTIMRSDFSSMQMLYPERGKNGELCLMAYRGFKPEAAISWKWISTDSDNTTCSKASRDYKRVIAENLEQCDYINAESRKMFRLTGIAACQSTPLFSRKGKLIGIISTHWKKPHHPSDAQFWLFNLLARHAADLLEYKKGTLQRSEKLKKILAN